MHLVMVIGAVWVAGLCSFACGAIAWFEEGESELKNVVRHGVIALGGGILVAAVCFALVPDGMDTLSPIGLALSFCAGGIVFCYVDVRLARHGGSRAQFMAMLLDFIPEALVLGAVFGRNHDLGILLALFIGLQNLPDVFNAFR